MLAWLQLLLNRSRYADVLEYLWWLNSHHKQLEGQLHGDKVCVRQLWEEVCLQLGWQDSQEFCQKMLLASGALKSSSTG
jgi:hypothetical protein